MSTCLLSKEPSDEEKELFKKYDLSKEQIDLYFDVKLTENEKYNLTPMQIIWCVVVKKVKKKIVSLMSTFSEIIEKKNFGKIELEERHLPVLNNFYFLCSPSLYSIDGSPTMFASASKFIRGKSSDKDIEEGYLIFFNRLMKSDPRLMTKGIHLVLDIGNFKWNDIPWDLKKAMTPIMTKIPFRINKIYGIRPPWYFKLALAILKPFTSKKILSKFVLLNDIDELKKLKVFNNIPTFIGGNVDIFPNQTMKYYFNESDYERKIVSEILKNDKREMLVTNENESKLKISEDEMNKVLERIENVKDEEKMDLVKEIMIDTESIN